MSLAQVRNELTQLQRSIQDQLRLIEDFRRANKENISLVRTELKGSTKGHDTKMLSALDAAESSLRKSSSQLQQAATALSRVQF